MSGVRSRRGGSVNVITLARQHVLARAAFTGQENGRVTGRSAFDHREQRARGRIVRFKQQTFLDSFGSHLVVARRAGRNQSVGSSNIHGPVIPKNAFDC